MGELVGWVVKVGTAAVTGWDVPVAREVSEHPPMNRRNSMTHTTWIFLGKRKLSIFISFLL
jgi:hypothetical protein